MVLKELHIFVIIVFGAAKKLKMPENQAQKEMGRFKETALMPITKGANPLNWWREHECEYPLLSKLAKRYLCIPGTSVSSDRVFSTEGDIITAQRNALTPEHLDQILFLHKNLKIKEVSFRPVDVSECKGLLLYLFCLQEDYVHFISYCIFCLHIYIYIIFI